jgi:hypothetical protein
MCILYASLRQNATILLRHHRFVPVQKPGGLADCYRSFGSRGIWRLSSALARNIPYTHGERRKVRSCDTRDTRRKVCATAATFKVGAPQLLPVHFPPTPAPHHPRTEDREPTRGHPPRRSLFLTHCSERTLHLSDAVYISPVTPRQRTGRDLVPGKFESWPRKSVHSVTANKLAPRASPPVCCILRHSGSRFGAGAPDGTGVAPGVRTAPQPCGARERIRWRR